jgi:hypothetical protein
VSVVKDDKHKAREILGDEVNAKRYRREIILLNSEAHRFAIEFYRNTHRKSMLVRHPRGYHKGTSILINQNMSSGDPDKLSLDSRLRGNDAS